MVANTRSDTSKLAVAQYVLTVAIAFVTGFWGWVTYTNEQARLADERAATTAAAERRAVAAMSRQLGLMDAQCPGTALIDLGEKPSPTPLETACFNAYIEAEALFFFTRTELRKPNDVPASDWNDLWSTFKAALAAAGDSKYAPNTLEVVWNDIVRATHEGRTK